MKEIAETNRKIDEAYDERFKRLEAKRKLVPDEREEEAHKTQLAILKERLNELKSRVSEARKEGKDPFMADLVLRNVNAKIKMAEVTHNKYDFETVERILNKAELELEEALKEEEFNVKKEIETRFRQERAKEAGKIIES